MSHDKMIKACEDSLQRLGTDYLDVYFLHYPVAEEEVTIQERMETMEELKKAGKSREEISYLKKFKSFEGNRPSNTIVFKKMDPYTLGMLIAMYEHKVFVQGVVWNVDSFDQYGVELGKQMALSILPELQGTASGINHDGSTNSLIGLIKRLRK